MMYTNRLFLTLLVFLVVCKSTDASSNLSSASTADYSNLKITEINYHPLDSINGLDTVKGKSYEFLEFRNTSTTNSIDLTGLKIDSAVYYEFPANFILGPQEYFVVADKPTWFMARYGYEASGNFEKNLSNSGEQIVVVTSGGQVIIDFEYSDDLPWPIEADGDGNTLVSVEHNPTGDPGEYSYWKSSKQIHGNPFGNDDNFVLSAEDLEKDIAVEVYPNPTNGDLNIAIDSYGQKDSKISIYNSIGLLVHNRDFSNELSLSLSELNLNYGIYIIVIENNNRVKNFKVVYNNK